MIQSSSRKQLLVARNLTFKQLLFQLNQQYQNNTFEINHSLRKATQAIFGSQQSIKIKITEQQAKQIKQELTLFLLALIKTPSTWAQLLRNDDISSQSTQITINTSQTITKVYKQMLKQVNNLIAQNRAKFNGYKTVDHQVQRKMSQNQPFSFQEQYMDQSCINWIVNLLNTFAFQICQFYKKSKILIENEAQQVEKQIQKSQIMNPYFLFGILKQMSTYTYMKVQEQMSVYFKSLPTETIVNFCRYVQKNYQFVQLTCSQKQPKIYTQQELHNHILEQNNFWLNFVKSLEGTDFTLKQIHSQKGDNAVMIVKGKNGQQNEQVFDDAEKLILKIGQDKKIRVTNSKISQKKWAIFDMKDTVSGLYKVLKQRIVQPSPVPKPEIAYGVTMGQYANFGGSVGKCLANINKYKSANAFLLDLSTSTLIGGSLTFALTQVPILQYFIIAGGFTYSFYYTFHNKTTSTKKKLKQLGKTSVTAVGSVGSAVAGMMLGQTLIPVPFLGAFVGGVIGGFLGATGTNLMTKLMNKQSFKNLIDFLHEDIVQGRYWIYSRQLLSRLGISHKYFDHQLCKNENKRDAYITGICFCVVTFYQSKRYIQRNEQKMKQMERKEELKHELQLVQEEQVFDNWFNIVEIVNYLTEQNLVLLHEHEKLQECIQHYMY